MGLDMYLLRMPRYKGANAHDITLVESYLEWIQEYNRYSDGTNMSFEEYTGYNKKPDEDLVSFCSKKLRPNEYGWAQVKEEVGYWRKANQIHRWFVENIQNGIDDCKYHREVTKRDLIVLRDSCQRVFDSCRIIHSEGRTIIEDPSMAEALLPCQEGFFFWQH